MDAENQRKLHSLVEHVQLEDALSKRPESPGPDALGAISKLRSGEPLDDSQASLLEGSILTEARPAMVFRGGRWSEPTATWSDHFDEALRARIDVVAAAVGRIDLANVPGLPFAGTGFLVGDGLVMTTRGVAELFTSGVGRTGIAIRPERAPTIEFRAGGGDGLRCRIAEALLVHPVLDLAILRLERFDPGWAPQAIAAVSADELTDHIVALVGHVGYDPERDITVFATLFRDALGCKHVSPGFVMKPRVLESRGQPTWSLAHDCTAFAGSAGGPLIDLETGAVVGMHLAGRRYDVGSGIAGGEMARDQRIAATGVRFEGELHPSDNVFRDAWEEADPAEELPREAARTRAPPARASKSLREEVEAVCASALSDEDLGRFLEGQGYGEVLHAVPRNVSSRDYRAGLLAALERRGLLDEQLLRALRAATGAPPVREEPEATEADVAQPPIPAEIADGLLDAVRDMSESELAALALGSRWRSWLVRPGAPASPVDTVRDLVRDPARESRQALAWLTAKLLQTLPPGDAQRLNALARAHAWLTSSGPARAPLDPAWPSDREVTDLRYLEQGLRAARAVALVSATTDESRRPNFTGSTGWLLAPTLLVVPSHLLRAPGAAKDEPAEDERAKRMTVRFDFDAHDAISKDVGVRGIELLDPRLDLAILRLAAEAPGERPPLVVNPAPLDDSARFLTMIHHPEAGPKKLSMRGGRLLESDAHEVVYMMATQRGSAGAPVLDMQWRVVATHRAWQNYRRAPDEPTLRAKVGTATGALLRAVREAGSESDALWREIVAAQPSLKVVDPFLYARLSELESSEDRAVVPMVIQLLGASDVLEGVPGLQVGVKGAHIVSATGTREAVDALAKHPAVLSVRASLPSGSFECATSVPYIGATKVHQQLNERGEQALIAVIDNGVDVLHRAFTDERGKTRIVAFWDQKDARSPANDHSTGAVAVSPAGKEIVDAMRLAYGALYVAEDLQGFLDREALPESFPNPVKMSHGTTVCSIAAGRRTGDEDTDFPGGIAPAASLIVVRYDLQDASVGYSSGHTDALNFIDGMATRLGKPVVVNISNGMNAGAHDGTSLVENRCEDFCGQGQRPGRIIVKSAGNERGMGRHAKLKVGNGSIGELSWLSQAKDPAGRSVPEIVELWFSASNQYRFRVRPPGPASRWSGEIEGPLRAGLDESLQNGNRLQATLNMINPENGDGSLRVTISRGDAGRVEDGRWLLEIGGVDVKDKKPIHAWVEETLNREVSFVDHLDDEVTITIPGTAKHVITVGAIQGSPGSTLMKPYDHSSSGPARDGQEKPEVVAPGVSVRGALANSRAGAEPRLTAQSGTSLAAPHVTGTIALALSAHAKKKGRDFNANELRTALQRSLRHLSIYNETTGFGELDAAALCTLLQQL